MPHFAYEATTPAGRVMKGTLEADSNAAAGQTLVAMGLTVISVSVAELTGPKTTIARNEFVLFNQQLAAIAGAGIPLERSLRQLARDVSSRRVRKLIEAVAADLEVGDDIRTALEKRSDQFPPLYARLVEAGVKSGRLGEMLTSLNRHIEYAGQTRRIIIEALSYPVTVIVIASLIFTLISQLVVPTYMDIFHKMGSHMPSVVRVLASVTDNIGWIWLAVGGAVAAAVLLRLVLKQFSTGRRITERGLMNFPGLGKVYYTGVLSRLADAMAVLVSAGCDMPACLRLGSVASGSENLQAQCETLAQCVESGQDVVTAGNNQRLLPSLFLYSVHLGSQRNELADNLLGLADMYAGQMRAHQGRLQAVLMPILLVLLGLFVGTIVLAMFLPYILLIRMFGSY